jgi:hypothetical protein
VRDRRKVRDGKVSDRKKSLPQSPKVSQTGWLLTNLILLHWIKVITLANALERAN